jgi:hypothetical protein
MFYILLFVQGWLIKRVFAEFREAKIDDESFRFDEIFL